MKTNLDSMFKADEASEKNGVWFNFGEKTGFLVSRFSPANPRIKQAMAKYHKPYARQIELGTLSNEKALEISIKLFVDTCLLDWRGVEIDEVAAPFNKESAIKLLTDLPQLYSTLQELANDFANYKEELDVEAVGNS